MKKITAILIFFMCSATAAQAQWYWGGPSQRITINYDVTITNLTKGQQLTPALVALTRNHSYPNLFTLGKPASDAIELLAEDGNTSQVLAALESESVAASQNAPGLINPGESVTVRFEEVPSTARLATVAAMLIPTNDAFFTTTIRLPSYAGYPTNQFVSAYDAGTELNDELCINIPGPVCGGEGLNLADGEGYVYIHNGIHGIGDLASSERDWKNPVARITITRSDN